MAGAFGTYYIHPVLPNEAEANDRASAARLAGIIMDERKFTMSSIDTGTISRSGLVAALFQEGLVPDITGSSPPSK